MSESLLSTEPPNGDLVPAFIEAGIPEMAARIMQAALELFARKGYAATSVREIVQEANITNPMLYYYFESKEGVFLKLIDFLFSSMQTRIETCIDGAKDLPAKVRAIAWAHIDGARRAPLTLQFIYSVIFGPEQSRPTFNIICSHEAMMARVYKMFDEAIASGEFEPHPGFTTLFLTEQLMGMINNHLMHVLKLVECADSEEAQAYCTQNYLSEEALDRLVYFFLAGAGKLESKESL
ncbi:MAG: TetR/AcrR family transcriptional regulator [Bradymonadaceae bacterium]|nr:TetR/AcrR family transcriptional regulator [Lujinxingiaceae bacterium]